MKVQNKYASDSKPQQSRLESLALLLAGTSTPSRFVDTPEFHHFCHTMDARFIKPGAAKMESLQEKLYVEQKVRLRAMIQEASRLTLSIDLWTTKGMTAAYLGVTATWFSPSKKQQQHALLSLVTMAHPHTSHNIKQALKSVIDEWDIPDDKVLLVITDNGANMIAAFKNVEESSDDDSDDESENNECSSDDIGTYPGKKPMRRLSCAPHTLQLVVKIALTSSYFQPVLSKVKHIVHQVKKSSKATERIVQLGGKGLVSDCITRWNSTLYMVSRFLELREHITVVLDEHGWQNITEIESKKLETLVTLLKPFQEHTDILQADGSTLSSLILAVLDLQCFLEDCKLPGCIAIAGSMKASLLHRTEHFLNPSNDNFEPLPAVAAYLDPTAIRQLMCINGQESLLLAARRHILNACTANADGHATEATEESMPTTTTTHESTTESEQPPRKKFKFLASRLPNQVNAPAAPTAAASCDSELCDYLVLVQQLTDDDQTQSGGELLAEVQR